MYGNPTSSLLNNLMLVVRFLNSGVLLRLELAVRLLYLRCEAEIKTSSCSGHQVSQSAEVVSSSGEGEQPPRFGDPSQLHFR